MKMKFPTSDRSRLDTLDKILLLSAQAQNLDNPNSDGVTASEQTTAIPAVTLPADLIENVQVCRSDMHSLVHQNKSVQQQHDSDRGMRDQLLSKARFELRCYLKALTLYRDTHPEEENPIAFYGLVDGNITAYSALQVLRAGQQVLQSAESAEAAGFPVITLGASQASFVETISKLGVVMERMTEAANAKTKRKHRRAEMHRACHIVLRRVAAYLRYAFQEYDPVDIRETMRAYGFDYVSSKSSKRSPDSSDETSGQVIDENPVLSAETQTEAVEELKAAE